MSRVRFTERQTLECAIRQGAVIPCYRCKHPFDLETVKTAEREHPHEIALGGPDTVEACAYSCGPCHAIQTNGTPATTAGSSKNKIAKIQPSRAEKFEVRKPALDADRVSQPSGRCRRCGHEPCQCPARVKRPAFAGRH